MTIIHSNILSLVGNTPTIELRQKQSGTLGQFNIFAKLEGYNPTGSIKDRPAAHVIRKLFLSKKIDRSSTIIESSSGNFGVALSAICRAEGLRFICVVDPNALESNLALMRMYGAELVYTKERDKTGGFLKSRMKRARELEHHIDGGLWINQYENQDNASSHYYGTGIEIYKQFADVGLQYAFIAVGSGGTVTGVSKALKSLFPDIHIVAVDITGSAIFGQPPKKRHIPGMGSSIRPPLIEYALIDEIIHVDEEDVIIACHDLVTSFGVFAGGSSGATYHAVKNYKYANLHELTYPKQMIKNQTKPNAILLFPDRGDRYLSTIYSSEWITERFGKDTYKQCGQGALET